MKIDLPLVLPPLRHILSRYFRLARSTLLVLALATVLSSVAAIAAPYLFSRLVDGLADAGLATTLLGGFLLYALLMGVSALLQRVVQFMSFMTAESLSFVSSTAFFERIVSKTSAFFLDHNPTEIQSAHTRGEGALNILMQIGLAALIPGTIQIVLSISMLGTVIDLSIALIVALYGAAYIALTYWSNQRTRAALDEGIKVSQESSRLVGNAIGAIDMLRQFRSDRWMIARFTDSQREVLSRFRAYAIGHIQFALIFGAALVTQFALTFYLLLPRVAAGELTVGDVVLFNTLLLQLNMPFQMVGQAIQGLVQSYSQFLPFATMWRAEAETDAEDAAPLALTDGTVSFGNVTYRYPGGRGIENVTFTARRGEITFLVGETGAGKTTIFKLLLKAVAPEAGGIAVDGIPLETIARADWFAAIASVPQDIMLLNDTLRTNIVLGRPFDEERLRRATKKAAILPFIERLEEGFDTMVGERGLKLSGGERQRIAIARALYGDPTILLLDEASSALDAATEKDIMDHLRLVSSETTVIAITHRLSVIGPEDQVVNLTPPIAPT